MKKLFYLLFLFSAYSLLGQEKTAQEVAVVDGKITPVDQTYVLNVNDQAEDFIVQMINGETIKLSDLKGQVVLLNFWATWCRPCIAEFRAFPSAIIEPFKNSPFVLLPISIGETEEKVREKMAQLKEHGVDFNVGINPDCSIFKMYSKAGIPKNYLIDQYGIIRYVSSGFSEEGMNELASKIQELLDEIEPLTDIEQKPTDNNKSATKNIPVFAGLLAVAIVVISYIKKKKNNKKLRLTSDLAK